MTMSSRILLETPMDAVNTTYDQETRQGPAPGQSPV